MVSLSKKVLGLRFYSDEELKQEIFGTDAENYIDKVKKALG